MLLAALLDLSSIEPSACLLEDFFISTPTVIKVDGNPMFSCILCIQCITCAYSCRVRSGSARLGQRLGEIRSFFSDRDSVHIHVAGLS